MMLKRNLAVVGICLVVFLLSGAYSVNAGDTDLGACLDDGSGTGYVVREDGNLELYENDTFKKTTHIFDDRPIAVSYTGNAVYVLTTTRNLPWSALKKCDGYGRNCSTIDFTFEFEPAGVSFANPESDCPSDSPGIGFQNP